MGESTMTTFDPLKAAKEILAAMTETRTVLAQMERYWEQKLDEADSNLNAIRKVLGHTDEFVIKPQREKVVALMEAEQQKDKQ